LGYWYNSLAVMVDTFKPLKVTQASEIYKRYSQNKEDNWKLPSVLKQKITLFFYFVD
jgi:hypothetical protein